MCKQQDFVQCAEEQISVAEASADNCYAEENGEGRKNHGIIKQIIATLHEEMDGRTEARRWRLAGALDNNDASRLWGLSTASVEAAYVPYLGFKDTEASGMKGRSKAAFVDKALCSPSPNAEEEDKRNN